MASLKMRKLCVSLLALVLSSPLSSSVFPSFQLTDGESLANSALTTLVSGPLRGYDLLVVIDDHSHRQLDVDRVVAAAGASFTPVVVASQISILDTAHPAHYTKSTHLTAILIFYDDPTGFLLRLEDNYHWNPKHLVLLCLNPQLNTTAVLSQPVVQRSQFILLLRSAFRGDQRSLLAYTSLPTQLNSLGHPLIQGPLGRWSPQEFPSRESLFPPRYRDFGGWVLHLSVWCNDEPLVYFLEDGSCTGQNVDALRIIADKYNFQFSLVHGTKDGKWGSYEDEKLVGMLGEVQRLEKDMIINSMLLTHNTLRLLDYTYPHTIDTYGFMIRIPPPMPRWRNILYPFSRLLWGLVFLTMVLVSTILASLHYQLYGIRDPLGLALKVAGGIAVQAMSVRGVRAWWAKVLLCFWWVVVLILTAGYTSNLVAVLTVPVYPSLLETVYDLAKDDIRVAMLDYGSTVPTYLRTTLNPTLAALGAKLDMGPITDPFNLYGEITKQVVAGTHALIVFGDYIDYLRQLHNVTQSTYVMKESLSDTLTRLNEMGILEKLYRMHMGVILSPNLQVRGDGVLNLEHLQGAFIMLVLGLSAASLTFLLEVLISPRPRPASPSPSRPSHPQEY